MSTDVLADLLANAPVPQQGQVPQAGDQSDSRKTYAPIAGRPAQGHTSG
jgi:hypothetical protein